MVEHGLTSEIDQRKMIGGSRQTPEIEQRKRYSKPDQLSFPRVMHHHTHSDGLPKRIDVVHSIADNQLRAHGLASSKESVRQEGHIASTPHTM